MIARRARTWVALAVLAVLVPSGSARAGDTASKKKPDPRSTVTSVPIVASSPATWESETAPYHGNLDNITWGGHGELRFGYDVTAGVSDPSWFSVGRVNGFMEAKLGSKLRLRGQASYDHVPDDFTLERAELVARFGRTLDAQAGIFLVPLGRTNLSHDAPAYEFGERSLVATQILGVPNAQLGVGVRGTGAWSRTVPLTYEVDLVTGFDDGVIMDASGGTRIPAGRNNYGDQNGLPAAVARFAIEPGQGEIGVAIQSGPYNRTHVSGVEVDGTRFVHVLAADAIAHAIGLRFATEAAAALIDIPPGLEGLYAERQWGASLEATRTLRAPLFSAWRGTSLSAGLRGETVDFDAGLPGDSRTRVSASLNMRPHPSSILRFGWYYEWKRDRFDNLTPLAGLTLTAASYF
jgi:hypothetical protein